MNLSLPMPGADIRQRLFVVVGTGFLIPTCALFMVLEWYRGMWEMVVLLGVGVVLTGAGLIIALSRHFSPFVTRGLYIYLGVLLLYSHGLGRENLALVFYMIVPLSSILIFGIREGIAWSTGVLVLTAWLIFRAPEPDYLTASAYLCVYALMVGFSVTFEALRAKAQRSADNRNRVLLDEQERLLKAKQELEASEQRFRQYAAIASDFLYEADAEMRVTYLSPRLADIIDRPASEFVGRNMIDVLKDWVPEVSPASVESLLAHQPFRDFPITVPQPDGSARYLRIRGEPNFDDDGCFIGYLGSGADITDYEQAQQELREKDRELHHIQKMEAIGGLTSGFAHDVNNLLNVIAGNLELLQLESGGKLDAVKFDAANSAVDRAAELTAQLLSFARRQPLQPRNVDASKLLDNMASMLERTLGTEIELHLIRDRNLWHAKIDPSQLESALLNLTINARHAIDGRGDVTIEARNRSLEGRPGLEAGDYVEIVVSDNGCGMPAHLVPRVVEPFFTTKPNGEGTGLGLSMVYGFVRQSGGQFDIESIEGEGTAVMLLLPRASEEDAESPRSAPARKSADSLEILLVEDQSELAKVVTLMLKGLGHTPTSVSTAEEALKLLPNMQPDMLITDVMLGRGMNGVELADRVSAEYPGIKILLVSGYPPQEVLKNRTTDYPLLGKPFNIKRLAEAIESYFRHTDQHAVG